MMKKEFITIIRDFTHTSEFQRMKGYRHHIKSSVYTHSVKVAYLCYKHHKRFGLKCGLKEFVIGALLHDYYLYDSHDKNNPHRFHWFKHSRCALQNALQRYPSLTETQQDMIGRHMFPVTPLPPTTWAGWLVCFYDKVAAVSDRFGRDSWKSRSAPLYCLEGTTIKNAVT